MPTPLHLRTDDDLVARARRGDAEAVGEIARRHRPRLVATARRILAGTGLDAEDAVQDVLAKLPRALAAHDRQLRLPAWLHAIVRNRCLDLRRAQRPLAELPVQLAASVATEPSVAFERRQDVLQALGALRALPERGREAFVLHALHGVPQADIATAAGTSVAVTKAHVFRSRQALRASITTGG